MKIQRDIALTSNKDFVSYNNIGQPFSAEGHHVAMYIFRVVFIEFDSILLSAKLLSFNSQKLMYKTMHLIIQETQL